MKAERIFLFLMTAVWLPYGLFCLAQPAFLETAAGLALDSTTADTEVRAMYGGLQAAIGALSLAGALRPSLARPALVMLAFLFAGLFSGRAIGMIMNADFSAYTVGAVIFEAMGFGFGAKLAAQAGSSPQADLASS